MTMTMTTAIKDTTKVYKFTDKIIPDIKRMAKVVTRVKPYYKMENVLSTVKAGRLNMISSILYLKIENFNKMKHTDIIDLTTEKDTSHVEMDSIVNMDSFGLTNTYNRKDILSIIKDIRATKADKSKAAYKLDIGNKGGYAYVNFNVYTSLLKFANRYMLDNKINNLTMSFMSDVNNMVDNQLTRPILVTFGNIQAIIMPVRVF